MNAYLKKILIIFAALILLLTGLFGLILPILPGLIFIALGLILLSFYSPSTQLWITKYSKPHPSLYVAIQKTQKWLIRFIEKF